MQKYIVLAVVFMLSVVISGCAIHSTAGPFISSISSDGKGGLIIEKSMVKYDPWNNAISNEGSTTVQIKLIPEENK